MANLKTNNFHSNLKIYFCYISVLERNSPENYKERESY